MKFTYFKLIVLFVLSSCINSKNISSFECTYSTNGTDRISESIVLRPTIITNKGIELIPQDPSSTQLISRYDNRTSKTLKEYKIKVTGGRRINNSSIIEIDNNDSLQINKRLQVVVSIIKDKTFSDTIDFPVDYKGRLSLNFDSRNSGGHANDVFVRVWKIHDSVYFKNFNCDLYKVTITSGNIQQFYYISEESSSLFISNRGGNGSNGSDGANGKGGAKGKDGADGFKGKEGESGGDGTDGGNGSNGGNGGRIFVTMDYNSEKFKNLIQFDNRGGFAGLGGKGGIGGPGGEGGLGGSRLVGENVLGEKKNSGATGPKGNNGRDGQSGLPGTDGPRIEFIIR